MLNRFAAANRSTPVAVWLFAVAGLVMLMVLVGGLTRLTHAGLSITEWKPVRGVVPPLNHAQWMAEFARYQTIPEYQQVNRGMPLGEFQGIYWWEWIHRLLGRVTGLVIVIPFVWFLVRRELPRHLVWRCLGLFLLVALQGLVGWWMVASGLVHDVKVAPERLMLHLGLALVLFIAALWAGFEALAGQERSRPPRGWALASGAILGLAFFQAMLGALVAGNRAGLIYNDWPLMNGKALPPVSWRGGPFHAFLHDQGLVQFDHRITAYLLLASVTTYLILAIRARMPEEVKLGAGVLCLIVWLQAILGVVALMLVVPVWLGALHQIGAVVVLGAATFGLWRMLRFEGHLFAGGIGAWGR